MRHPDRYLVSSGKLMESANKELKRELEYERTEEKRKVYALAGQVASGGPPTAAAVAAATAATPTADVVASDAVGRCISSFVKLKGKFCYNAYHENSYRHRLIKNCGFQLCIYYMIQR